MPVQSRPNTKRLPLSSQSSYHNQQGSSTSHIPFSKPYPSTSSSSPAKKRVIRPVKSNPNLRLTPSTDAPPPLPNSPSYPITSSDLASDGTPVAETLLAPPKVAFAPEIFVHRHARDFPHLHNAAPALAVPRRTSPVESIVSEVAVAALACPLPTSSSFTPLSPPMSPPLDNDFQQQQLEEDNQTTPKKKRVSRPLSLVALQPGGGLFGHSSGVPLPSELGTIHQEEVMAEEPRVVGEGDEVDAGMEDSRQSSEISSECNLSFTWEQSEPRARNAFVFPTPQKQEQVVSPPRTRVAFNDLPPLGAVIPSSTQDRTVYRKSAYTPTSPTFDTVAEESAAPSFSAPTFSLPPTPVTPALSFFSSSTSSTSQFTSPNLPPVPSMPLIANYSRPRPAHTRGPSIGYRHTPSPVYDPSTLPADHQSPPTLSQALPSLPTSVSEVSVISHDGQSAWIPSSSDQPKGLFWETASEVADVGGPNWRSTMSGAEELNRLEVEAAAGLLTKSRSDGKLVYGGGVSTGMGESLRERYLRDGPQNFSLSRPDPDPRSQLLESTAGVTHNPTPSAYLNPSTSTKSFAPPSLAPSRSSWTSWLGGAPSSRRSRRASEQHHTSIDATQMENGEVGRGLPQSAPHDRQSHDIRSSSGTFGIPRPAWTKRNGSLLLDSPMSHESSGSGSSFGNAPGEIFGPSPTSGLGFDWPSSPASNDGNSLFAPSPRMRSSSADSLAPPAAAQTYRRPSTTQDAYFAALSLPQTVLLPPTPNAPAKGLKPLILSAPPKHLRKTLRSTLMPTIAGSPSKRALEEGRNGQDDEDDVDEYYTQAAAPPSSTVVNISVLPPTPMKHPAPPSPVLQAKTTEIPSHQRTYSSAFSPSNNAPLSSVHLAPSFAAARPSFHLRSRSSTMTANATTTDAASSAPRVSFSSNNGPAFAVATRPASRASLFSMAQKVVAAPVSWMEDLLPAQVIFFLGFCLGPWTWIIGGWGLSSDGLLLLGNLRSGRHRPQSPLVWVSASPHHPSSMRDRQRSSIGSTSSAVVARENVSAPATTKRKPWILPALRRDNPNRWVYRCRIAAIISGLVVIPGLILAVIFSCI